MSSKRLPQMSAIIRFLKEQDIFEEDMTDRDMKELYQAVVESTDVIDCEEAYNKVIKRVERENFELQKETSDIEGVVKKYKIKLMAQDPPWHDPKVQSLPLECRIKITMKYHHKNLKSVYKNRRKLIVRAAKSDAITSGKIYSGDLFKTQHPLYDLGKESDKDDENKVVSSESMKEKEEEPKVTKENEEAIDVANLILSSPERKSSSPLNIRDSFSDENSSLNEVTPQKSFQSVPSDRTKLMLEKASEMNLKSKAKEEEAAKFEQTIQVDILEDRNPDDFELVSQDSPPPSLTHQCIDVEIYRKIEPPLPKSTSSAWLTKNKGKQLQKSNEEKAGSSRKYQRKKRKNESDNDSSSDFELEVKTNAKRNKENKEELAECPMCSKLFSQLIIERHASTCGES